ncbi:unnamed protein product [Rhodiola kirilowii]
MYTFLKTTARLHKLVPTCIYTKLLNQCVSSKSITFTKSAHSLFIKLGFTHTFLGNRLLDLYSELGTFADAYAAFVDIKFKNLFSFNIYLKALCEWGRYDDACKLFDEMPVRDAVTWNTIISASAEFGYSDAAIGFLFDMGESGVRYTEFTYSIILSVVCSSLHVRQVHGNVLRCGVSLSHVVVGNSLIDAYGKFGLDGYALGVFQFMDCLDVISWNSLIWGCYKSGNQETALNHFLLMKASGFSPDEFTISTTFAICCDLRDIVKGRQVCAFCLKVGHFSNTLVASAAINLFSKCGGLQDAIWLFNEANRWDSAVCNSMIASYVHHDFGLEALNLFVLSMKENIRPTEFTMSSVLNCVASLFPLEQVSQFHSMVCKLGFMLDQIVASSLVDTYLKFGWIEPALKLFANISGRDLISWNTMILGLTRNGRVTETLNTFKEFLEKGQAPDRITLAGVLLACNDGGLVEQGMQIFFSMEEEFGVMPGVTHYTSIIDLLSRAGKVDKALELITSMPHESTASIWGSILCACSVFGDLKLIEMVAERVFELEPKSSLAYLVLALAYESRAKWESLVRLRKALYGRIPRPVMQCSSISLRNKTYVFHGNHIGIYGGHRTYLMLRLLAWEIEQKEHSHPESSLFRPKHRHGKTLTISQKLWYCIGNVGGQYLWSLVCDLSPSYIAWEVANNILDKSKNDVAFEACNCVEQSFVILDELLEKVEVELFLGQFDGNHLNEEFDEQRLEDDDLEYDTDKVESSVPLGSDHLAERGSIGIIEVKTLPGCGCGAYTLQACVTEMN